MSESSIREHLSPDQRNYEPRHGIDAGFLNYRRLLGFVPRQLQREIEAKIGALPAETHPHYRKLKMDHLYIDACLQIAQQQGARTSVAILAADDPSQGEIIASTDQIIGSRDVYEKPRVELPLHFDLEFNRRASLRFSTKNIEADTAKMQLSRADRLSYVGLVEDVSEKAVVIAPLVMGGPWLHPGELGAPDFEMMFSNYEFFENFVDDIDEFERVQSIPRDEASEAWKVLRDVPEAVVKQSICELLRDVPVKDWGGEASDHFTTSLHLSGRRTSAAFLLKGPSDFTEMKARHLGKNGDQIVRLATEPAALLVLQHSHLVSPPVRQTLRMFAVNPANPRRYCVLDGPDTYRLMCAYGKLSS